MRGMNRVERSNRGPIALVAVALLSLTACGGFHLRVAAPARPMVVSAFEVVYGADIPPDRRSALDRIGAPLEMQRALRASYPAGAGPIVRVIITQFVSGRWGPTRMHTVTQVVDPAQRVVSQIETDSTSVMAASRGGLIHNVAQDTVNQIAAGL